MNTVSGTFKRQDMHTATIDSRMYVKNSSSVIPQDLKEGDQVQVEYTTENVPGVPWSEIRTIVKIEKT